MLMDYVRPSLLREIVECRGRHAVVEQARCRSRSIG
jgi:hypothetical protein